MFLRALQIGLFALTATALFSCSKAEVVVNRGPATPLAQRTDARAFDAIPDRTGIAAHEFGACESDADCAPRGCEGSVCSPEEHPAVCNVSQLAMCLATLSPRECGCHEGFCRWARTPPVMQCAVIAQDQAGNRAYIGSDYGPYPQRPQY